MAQKQTVWKIYNYWVYSILIGLLASAWPLLLGYQEIQMSTSGDTTTIGLLIGIFDLPGVLLSQPLLSTIPDDYDLHDKMVWMTIYVAITHFVVGTAIALFFFRRARRNRKGM